MIRRLIFLSALIYTVVHLSKRHTKRTGGQADATAVWESEGGTPASESSQ
jgi:hypothetical protein